MTKANRDSWSEPLVKRLLHVHGGDRPEEAVERFVSKLLLESGHGESMPVRVEALASFLGIRVRVIDCDFAGRVYAEESGSIFIDVKRTDPEGRRRFTIAHELVHTAFPGFTHETRYRVDEHVGRHLRLRSEEEFLCDHGAAALLMPADAVRDSFGDVVSLGTIEALADQACVSLEAAGNRQVRLTNGRDVFIVAEVMHKPADLRLIRKGDTVEPQLRVRYASNSGVPFLPKYKSLAEVSVMNSALYTDGTVVGTDFLPGGNAQVKYDIQAKSYPWNAESGKILRVLALARPSA
jgi:Zn-dependent peptidase ImmA (M78 family)